MRLSLLAKRTGLSIIDITNLLESNGYTVEYNPNTVIPMDLVRGINEIYPLDKYVEVNISGRITNEDLTDFSKYPISKMEIIPKIDKKKISETLFTRDLKTAELFKHIRETNINELYDLYYGLVDKIEEAKKETEKAEKEVEEAKKEAEEAKKEVKEIKEKIKVLEKKKAEVGKKHIQIAMHAVKQFYGHNKILTLFTDEKVDAFSDATGLNLTNRPTNYGVVLNQAQSRVFEGILQAFTYTNYKGNEQRNKKTALGEVYSDTIVSAQILVKGDNAPYKNIDTIPVVKLTQADIIELSGYDLKAQKQSDKQHVTEALSFLSTNQFCFYWIRLKTENGKPVKDKKGDYVKEEVMEVGTLLRIKTIKDETGVLQYYEIQPSAPLLDQVNNYFLLVPNNWRDEVKQLTGKRASSYTYELLLWLRLQYEQIRQYNKGGGKNRKTKNFKISESWEDVAIALKMPESMYKRNRDRSYKIIQEAYSVAIKLGYLIKVENNGATDILYLNEEYYPKPGELV